MSSEESTAFASPIGPCQPHVIQIIVAEMIALGVVARRFARVSAQNTPDANAYSTCDTYMPTLPALLYRHSTTVVRTPNSPHTLINTLHGLCRPLQLLPACISQELHLLQDLFPGQVPYTNRFLPSIDVMPCYDWVFVLSW